MDTVAIASHLNVAESAIKRIEEWASVLFVVCEKIGARFVSKEVMKKKAMPVLRGSEKQVEWADRLRNICLRCFEAAESLNSEYEGIASEVIENAADAKVFIEIKELIAACDLQRQNPNDAYLDMIDELEEKLLG